MLGTDAINPTRNKNKKLKLDYGVTEYKFLAHFPIDFGRTYHHERLTSTILISL